MERVFQDFSGRVVALEGLQICSFKSLEDSVGDVIFLWIQDAASLRWYRIFIDGVYCGVDRYDEDLSDDDLDDEVSFVDFGDRLFDKTIKSAVVFHSEEMGYPIALTLDFKTDVCVLSCSSEEGCCTLQFEQPCD